MEQKIEGEGPGALTKRVQKVPSELRHFDFDPWEIFVQSGRSGSIGLKALVQRAIDVPDLFLAEALNDLGLRRKKSCTVSSC